MDRWTLYEHCVQSPRDACDLLLRAHGGAPRRLLEDFAGSAAIAREWTRRGGTAVALDLDGEALGRASDEVSVVRADVMERAPFAEGSFDVVHAGNFSLGYLRERATLLAYLRERRRLLAGGGVLVGDTYGGRNAFELGAWDRERFLGGGVRVVSTWEHRRADPVTALVENVLHFRVERDGELVARHPDAFTYRWRLWSLPELRDLALEAGFRACDVFPDASGPLAPGAALDPDFSVALVARA